MARRRQASVVRDGECLVTTREAVGFDRRRAWESFYGVALEGAVLRVLCGRRGCLNPQHVILEQPWRALAISCEATSASPGVAKFAVLAAKGVLQLLRVQHGEPRWAGDPAGPPRFSAESARSVALALRSLPLAAHVAIADLSRISARYGWNRSINLPKACRSENDVPATTTSDNHMEQTA